MSIYEILSLFQIRSLGKNQNFKDKDKTEYKDIKYTNCWKKSKTQGTQDKDWRHIRGQEYRKQNIMHIWGSKHRIIVNQLHMYDKEGSEKTGQSMGEGQH